MANYIISSTSADFNFDPESIRFKVSALKSNYINVEVFGYRNGSLATLVAQPSVYQGLSIKYQLPTRSTEADHFVGAKGERRAEYSFSYLRSGENQHINITMRNAFDFYVDQVDIAVGMYRPQALISEYANYICFPYYVEEITRVILQSHGHHMSAASPVSLAELRNFVQSCEQKRRQNPFLRPYQATLVALHDSTMHQVGVRGQLLRICNSIFSTNVLCPSRYNHNTELLKEVYQDNKIDFLHQVTFNLCPENSWTTGYVTEKIVQAIWTGSIPIYWGGIHSEQDIFNLDAILYYDPRNPEHMVNKLVRLYTDLDYQAEFIHLSPFQPGAAEIIFLRYMLPFALRYSQQLGLDYNFNRNPDLPLASNYRLLADARQAAKTLASLGKLEDRYLPLLQAENNWPFYLYDQQALASEPRLR